MALNVSSTLIYAGRYHYGKTVTANLLDKKNYLGADWSAKINALLYKNR